MANNVTGYNRKKKRIPEMMPIKKWLTLLEALSFMDMSINRFQELAIREGLTISMIGKKKYYKVIELEQLIESNIVVKQAPKKYMY